jgi:hypothetical protein
VTLLCSAEYGYKINIPNYLDEADITCANKKVSHHQRSDHPDMVCSIVSSEWPGLYYRQWWLSRISLSSV